MTSVWSINNNAQAVFKRDQGPEKKMINVDLIGLLIDCGT